MTTIAPKEVFITAGPPKTGTTSLFRYLSIHPKVCPSSKKEIHFFLQDPGANHEDVVRGYLKNFPDCADQQRIKIEISPRYMIGGAAVAKRIKEYLGEQVKMLFILREPVSRYLSRYRSLRSKTDLLPSQLSLPEIVYRGLENPNACPTEHNIADIGIRTAEIRYLWEGYYATFIAEYLKYFPPNAIKILFFDQLCKDPRRFMEDVCEFLEVDPGIYDSYHFTVENKTLPVRYMRLHKLAEKLNRKAEFLLNRNKTARDLLRRFYFQLVNPLSTDKDIELDDAVKKRLNEYYHPANQELRHLMGKYYSTVELPAWLE